MSLNLSFTIKEVIAQSKREAYRLGNQCVVPEHFMLGLLSAQNSTAVRIMRMLNIDLNDLQSYIELSIGKNKADANVAVPNDIPLSATSERVIRRLTLEAQALDSTTIGTPHLLLSIMREKGTFVEAYFSQKEIDFNDILNIVNESSRKTIKNSFDTDDDDDDGPFSESQKKPENQRKSGGNTSETPVLDNFGIDMTKAAEEGRLDPVVGREKEIERLAQILSRRKKNNPILIGEPGVGKSAIAEGLAIRIHEKKVSRVLFNKRVIALDLASIVAGTKYRGQFEERVKAMLNELRHNQNVNLFIDEI